MDNKVWKNNWEVIEALNSGGQGNAKVVIPKHINFPKRFLKILSKQNDIERRKRMYREVAAYSTLNHSGIPKLIESNTEHYQDSEYKLYLVTEHIDGSDLYEFINNNEPFNVSESINLILKLIDIVIYCHSQECLHRDIKPNNIVLLDNNKEHPILVDFGLSFISSDSFDFQTEHGQEIGNRFLRLPEFGIDSANKRDQRSDITLICGIFIYILTGCQPVNLIDENSRMPHQREHIYNNLLKSEINLKALLNIFDRGFQNNIQNRWNSGEHLREALFKLVENREEKVAKNSENILSEIKNLTSSASMQVATENSQRLSSVLGIFNKEFSSILGQLGNTFTNFQTDRNVDVGSLSAKNTLGVKKIDGTGQVQFKFSVSIIGSDLIISISDGEIDEELLRTDSVQPRYDEEFKEELRKFILSGIHGIL